MILRYDYFIIGFYLLLILLPILIPNGGRGRHPPETGPAAGAAETIEAGGAV